MPEDNQLSRSRRRLAGVAAAMAAPAVVRTAGNLAQHDLPLVPLLASAAANFVNGQIYGAPGGIGNL
jgi:hypothetical protein